MIQPATPVVMTTAHPSEQAPASVVDNEDHSDMGNHEMRSERIRRGMCPSCGTQLYKVKKPNKLGGLLKKKGTPQPKPLTIEGRVLRGQCISCMGVGVSAHEDDQDEALAEALLLSEVEYSQSNAQSLNNEIPSETVDEVQDQQHQGEGRKGGALSIEQLGGVYTTDSQGITEIILATEDVVLDSSEDVPASVTTSDRENSSDAHGHAVPGFQVLIAEVEDPPAAQVALDTRHLEPDHSCSDEEEESTTDEDDGSETQGAAVPLIAPIPTIAAMPVAAAIPEAKAAGFTTYKGDVNDMGVRHGKGELKWANGDRYKGNFFGGVREGSGTLFFANGGEYVGEWESNNMHGEGTQRFVNGDVYTGQFVKGKRSGQGRCYFANGDLYTGSWHNDMLNGYGTYYYNKGQSFQGFFKDNKRQGRGKYQYVDGKVDVNWYVNGTKSGDGVRWSRNRRKVWKVSENGKVKKRVSLEQADEFVRSMGRQQ